MRTITKLACLLLTCLITFSCQQVADDFGEESEIMPGTGSITFNIGTLEQIPFENGAKKATRAQNIKNLCSKIVMDAYQNDKAVLKRAVTQTSSDDDFGKLTLSLDPGTYRVVIVAHNSSSNPSMTNPRNLDFGNRNMSDTFLWSQDVEIKDGESKEETINMNRVVGMFRLITTDNVPSSVSMMRFVYKGGSNALDAVSGYGVSSTTQQTEAIEVSETGKPGTFEILTFPKEGVDTLNIQAKARDSDGETVASHTFYKVPIDKNKITQYKGAFFNGATGEKGTLNASALTTDDEWTLDEHTF